jgi:hypothetical protein
MMEKHLTRTILLLVFLLVVGLQVVELAIANPVYWPVMPITDKPTVTIERPTNNTTYNNTAVYVSLTVTNPDSWKREGLIPIPSYYALVDSVNAYLDGKRIFLSYNYTDYTTDEWVKDQSYFCVLGQTAPRATAGQHMLNVTVVSLSYYRGPAYNGSHIDSGRMSSDGPVYQYPLVVSELVYFTAVGEPSPSPTPIPSSQEIGSFTIETVAIVSLVTIAVVGAGLLIYFKKHKR